MGRILFLLPLLLLILPSLVSLPFCRPWLAVVLAVGVSAADERSKRSE